MVKGLPVAMLFFLAYSCSHGHYGLRPTSPLEKGTVGLKETEGLQIEGPEAMEEVAEKEASKNRGELDIGALIQDISTEATSSAPQPKIVQFFDPKLIESAEEKDLVKFWVAYFTQKGRDRFIRHFQTGEKYRKMVEDIFISHNLPPELYYVGLIESGFNLKVKSRARAVGPWQFMKATAKRYGLQVNNYIDERRNIFKSTHAAALYLKDLYNIFGDWPLALAAYNSGEYKVLNAIRKGKTRKYLELSEKRLLPKETRYYIPKLIAVKKIIEERHLFADFWNGVDLSATIASLEDHPFYGLTANISLHNLARIADVSRDTILDLNPDIKGHAIPATPRVPFRVYLPGPVLEKLTAGINDPKYLKKTALVLKVRNEREPRRRRGGGGTYKIRKGDSIFAISRRLGVNSKALMALNGLTTSSKLRIGKRLSIPNAVKPKRVYKRYTVRKGDSLFKIANRFNISLEELIDLNSLDSKKIFPNQKIRIPI